MLRLLDADAFRRETDETDARRMDAEARARIEAAEEGDLLVLGAVAKKVRRGSDSEHGCRRSVGVAAAKAGAGRRRAVDRELDDTSRRG